MKSRLTFASIFGLAAAVLAAASARSGADWVHVLAAPAWRMAAMTSGSRAPGAATIDSWAFAIGFLLGFLAAPALTLPTSPTIARRLLVVNLLGIYAVVVLALFLFPHVADGLLETVGAGSVVGEEFLVVLATRLMPVAGLYLVVITVSAYGVLRIRPTRLAATFAVIWMLTFAGILASVAWYASPIGPAVR